MKEDKDRWILFDYVVQEITERFLPVDPATGLDVSPEDLPSKDLINKVAFTVSRYVDDIICDQINNSPLFKD